MHRCQFRSPSEEVAFEPRPSEGGARRVDGYLGEEQQSKYTFY